MKKFNLTLFASTAASLAFLTMLGFGATYEVTEFNPRSNGIIWILFRALFQVLTFPTHFIFSKIIEGPFPYFGGLIVNCLLYSLLIERVFYLIKNRQKKLSN